MSFFTSKWFPLSLLGVLGVFGLAARAMMRQLLMMRGAAEADLLAVAS